VRRLKRFTFGQSTPNAGVHRQESMMVLQIAALTKHYGEQPALEDVGFTVQAGEISGPDRTERRRQDDIA
jgi:hypothetical protein